MRKKAIIKAIRKEDYSKRQLDPKGKGSAVARLMSGGGVSDAKIHELYARLLDLQGREAQANINKNEENLLIKIQATVEAQQAEIEKLKQKLLDIEKENTEATENKNKQEINKPEKKTLFGFAIANTKIKVGGKEYWVYKAYRRFAGQAYFVYIGKDLSKAEGKIRAALKKESMAKISEQIQKEYPDYDAERKQD